MRFFTACQSYLKLVLYDLAKRQELALPLFITYMQGRVKLNMIQMGMLESWLLIDSLIMIIELLRFPYILEPYSHYTPERIFLAIWVFYISRQTFFIGRTPETQMVAEVHHPDLLGYSLGHILSPLLDGNDQRDADSGMVYDLCYCLHRRYSAS